MNGNWINDYDSIIPKMKPITIAGLKSWKLDFKLILSKGLCCISIFFEQRLSSAEKISISIEMWQEKSID